jgi:type II/III secretion system protein
MRNVLLVLLTAIVLAIPTAPARAVAETSGVLDDGTRLLLTLRTVGLPTLLLDLRPPAGETGSIVIGTDEVFYELPLVERRGMVSNVMLPSSGTTFLGGLVIDKVKQKKVSHKIPWLSDVPLLGELFRSQVERTTRSLVIFVTPTLVEPNKKPKQVEGPGGDFRVDDAKGKGSVRVVKNFTQYRGSFKWIIKGTWLDGPAAGKTFKATVKGKLKGTRF